MNVNITNTLDLMSCSGVLNLVRSHRPFIEHVRIVIGSSKSQERERRRVRQWEKRQQHQQEQQNESFRTRSQTWACENDDINQTGDIHASLASTFAQTTLKDQTSLGLDLVKPKITRDGRSYSLDVMHASQANLPPQLNENIDSNNAHEEEKYEQSEALDDEDKNYHLLFVLDSDSSAQTFVTDLHHRPCEFIYFFLKAISSIILHLI